MSSLLHCLGSCDHSVERILAQLPSWEAYFASAQHSLRSSQKFRSGTKKLHNPREGINRVDLCQLYMSPQLLQWQDPSYHSLRES